MKIPNIRIAWHLHTYGNYLVGVDVLLLSVSFLVVLGCVISHPVIMLIDLFE